eukprot:TRINITY_DN10582_c0_g1_i6.p1 TRINITY_DN10582_c0_g1~~TRINITY_DN10582_c0_g1_i6.p1  ORF type:complete len:500 (-),score=72.19 TRINITY_DN10582_c0_g1_i6:261-1760(-)
METQSQFSAYVCSTLPSRECEMLQVFDCANSDDLTASLVEAVDSHGYTPKEKTTVTELVTLATADTGGAMFVLAPQDDLKHLQDNVESADEGYMTARLRGIHISSSEFSVIVREFRGTHSHTDRWPTDHPDPAARGQPMDGAFLLNTDGYRVKCAVKIKLPPAGLRWPTGMGTRHSAALDASYVLQRGVVLVCSDSGAMHGLVHKHGKVMAYRLLHKVGEYREGNTPQKIQTEGSQDGYELSTLPPIVEEGLLDANTHALSLSTGIDVGVELRALAERYKQDSDKKAAARHMMQLLAGGGLAQTVILAISENTRTESVRLLASSPWYHAVDEPILDLLDDDDVEVAVLALASVQGDGWADRELVLVAVQTNGLALQFAAEPLRSDRELVLAARRLGARVRSSALEVRPRAGVGGSAAGWPRAPVRSSGAGGSAAERLGAPVRSKALEVRPRAGVGGSAALRSDRELAGWPRAPVRSRALEVRPRAGAGGSAGRSSSQQS